MFENDTKSIISININNISNIIFLNDFSVLKLFLFMV